MLWYDYKEKNWYHEKTGTTKQQYVDSVTTVCILATVHKANPNYNADSIVDILNLFQPDLILTEEDTLLFEAIHKEYKQNLQMPLFARVGRSFGFGGPGENEGRAVRKYKINHSSVDIRPYDYEGRNALYEKNHTFSREDEITKRIESLTKNRLLNGEQTKIWSVYGNINDTLNTLSNQTPYSINQQTYYDITERRQEWQYHKVAEIISTNDNLKEYLEFYRNNGEFWDIRNKEMAKHIAIFIQLYPKKRIMVLTGAFHKYYLLKELTSLQDQLKFRLREYYE